MAMEKETSPNDDFFHTRCGKARKGLSTCTKDPEKYAETTRSLYQYQQDQTRLTNAKDAHFQHKSFFCGES